MLPQHDDLEFDADVVSILPPEGTRLPGPVLTWGRQLLANQLIRGDGEAHGVFALDYGDTKWTVTIRQEPWGGHKLIFTESGCVLSMDSGVMVFTNIPTDTAPVVTPAGNQKPSLQDGRDYHPFGGKFPGSPAILAATLVADFAGPTIDATYTDAHSQAFRRVSGALTAEQTTVLADKKVAAAYSPGSIYSTRFRRLIQALYGAPLVPHTKALSRRIEELQDAIANPMPGLQLFGTNGILGVTPTSIDGWGVNVDTAGNYSLLHIEGLTGRDIDVYPLTGGCKDPFKRWLVSEEGVAATQEQRDQIEMWYLSQVSSRREPNRKFEIWDMQAGEDDHQTHINSTGALTADGSIFVVGRLENLGYGYKFSPTGRRAARVWFHFFGRVEAGTQMTNGDMEALEHEYLMVRDPDIEADIAAEATRWTVTSTLHAQVQYRSYSGVNVDGVAADQIGPTVDCVYSWRDVSNVPHYVAFQIPVPLVSNASTLLPPQASNTFGLPDIVPIYVIGYDDDEGYYRLDIDFPNTRFFLNYRDVDGADATVTSGPFDATTGLDATTWRACIPMDNAECLVVFPIADPMDYPLDAHRFTPRGGWTTFEIDAFPTGVIRDREAAISGVHVLHDATTGILIPLTEEYDGDTVDRELDPQKYSFIGYE